MGCQVEKVGNLRSGVSVLDLNMLKCGKYLTDNIEIVTIESFVLTVNKLFNQKPTTRRVQIERNLLLEKMSVDGLFEGRLVHVCITENYPNRQILSFSHVRSGAVFLLLWSGFHYSPDWSIVIQTETQAETQNRSEVQDVKSAPSSREPISGRI